MAGASSPPPRARATGQVYTIGVLADTHLPHRLDRLPDKVLHLLQGSALILHAGDVDDSAFLESLRSLAPIYAVRGNWHFLDLSNGGAELPHEVHLTIQGWHLVLTHGHLPGLRGFLWKGYDFLQQKLLRQDRAAVNRILIARLRLRYPEADIIVFGHSHHPCRVWIDGTLFFNPGAVCPTHQEVPSVGRIVLSEGLVEATILPLGSLPAMQERNSFPRRKRVSEGQVCPSWRTGQGNSPLLCDKTMLNYGANAAGLKASPLILL
jgi:putative phosphoesterase